MSAMDASISTRMALSAAPVSPRIAATSAERSPTMREATLAQRSFWTSASRTFSASDRLVSEMEAVAQATCFSAASCAQGI